MLDAFIHCLIPSVITGGVLVGIHYILTVRARNRQNKDIKV